MENNQIKNYISIFEPIFSRSVIIIENKKVSDTIIN